MDRKHRCHVAVRAAIKAGTLQRKPCERCDSPFDGPAHHPKHKVVAHHDDYSKPLSVTWLCCQHHVVRHEELGWGLKPRIFPKKRLHGLPIGGRIRLRTNEPSLFRAMAHQAAKKLGIKLAIVLGTEGLSICRVR